MSGEWLLHSIYSGTAQRFITDMSNATTVPHINMSDIPDIPIALPPREEQDRLLSVIREKVRQAEEINKKLNRQVLLLTEHRQALITAAVTGELEVAA